MRTKLYMYIPEIGEQLTLEEDWNFVLFKEYRNNDFAKKFGYGVVPYYYPLGSKYEYNFLPLENCKQIEEIYTREFSNKYKSSKDYDTLMSNAIKKIKEELPNLKDEMISELNLCLPKGTVIIPDRIYIRKGKSDYSSITFRIGSFPGKKRFTGRFWVPLKDVNNICCSVDV